MTTKKKNLQGVKFSPHYVKTPLLRQSLKQKKA